ncbi:hypothetical protein CR513_53390, partial [Mucuna pruriens]
MWKLIDTLSKKKLMKELFVCHSFQLHNKWLIFLSKGFLDLSMNFLLARGRSFPDSNLFFIWATNMTKPYWKRELNDVSRRVNTGRLKPYVSDVKKLQVNVFRAHETQGTVKDDGVQYACNSVTPIKAIEQKATTTKS